MNKKRIWSVLLAVLIVMSTVSPAFGVTIDSSFKVPVTQITESNSNDSVRLIVELKGEPVIESAINAGVSYTELNSNEVEKLNDELVTAQNQVFSKIQSLNDDVVLQHTFTASFNGFSCDATYADIAKIKALPNVKNVYIAKQYTLPEPQMNNSKPIIHTNSMWDVGYKGEGMVVAVIDSGIDYMHPDFKLTNDATGRITKSFVEAVVANQDLAAENFGLTKSSGSVVYTANDFYKSAKVPFAYDYADRDADTKPDLQYSEASEHGGHVSGTVAANGAIKGVAPEAQILSLKVFSDKDKYASEDTIVAAIDDAVILGADVINMSLGSTSGFTDGQDPEQISISRAEKAGLLISVSAGNSYRFGQGNANSYNYTWHSNPDTGLVGSPSAGADTFSVASSENTIATLQYIKSSEGLKIKFQPTGNADPVTVFNQGPVEYVYCGLGGTDADFAGKDLTGKIALIKRGSYNFTDKISNAEKHGAAGVIVFNSKYEPGLISMAYPDNATIPAMFISQADGNALNAATVKTVEFDPANWAEFAKPDALEMSDFSSWGPTPSLEFKPEITAPGGDIYSTVNDGKYTTMSGTSMAAPHIAGASAIVMQYIDKKFPTMTEHNKGIFAKALMMGTANPIVDPYGTYYSVRKQGAGLLNLDAVVNTDVYPHAVGAKKEAKINMKEVGDVFEFQVALENFSSNDHQYVISGSTLTDALLDNTFRLLDDMMLEGTVITVSGSNLIAAQSTTVGVITITPDVDASTINVYNTKELVKTTTNTPIVIVPVAGNSTNTITVKVDISNVSGSYEYADKKFMPMKDALEILCNNGYFVEGYVEFIDMFEAGIPNLSIPYLAFNGEWDAAPVFDLSAYDKADDGSDLSGFYFDEKTGTEYHRMVSDVLTTVDSNMKKTTTWRYLGFNPITGNWDWDTVAFSPNNDQYKDTVSMSFSLLRNIKTMNVKILDANKNSLGYISLNKIKNMRKPYSGQPFYIMPDSTLDDEKSLIWDGKINDKRVADGQYYYEIEASVDGFGTQIYTYPVVIDTKAPKVSSVSSTSPSVVTVTATDEHQIAYYLLMNQTGEVVAESALNTIDVTGLSLNGYLLSAVDYAGNESIYGLTVGNAGAITLTLVYSTPAPTPDPTPTPVTPDPGAGLPTTPGTPGTPTTPVTPTTPTTPATPGQVDPAKLGVSTGATGTVVTLPADVAKAAVEAAKGGAVVIQLPASVDATKPVSVSLPNAALEAAAKAGSPIVIQGTNVTFELPAGFADFAGKDVTVQMAPKAVEKYNVEEGVTPLNVAYELDVLVDGKKVGTFKAQPELSFKVPAGTINPQNVGVWVQEADGSWKFIMTTFDAQTGMLTAKAPHFSAYALMSYSKTFADIKGHWAQANIEEMLAKFVASGVSETSFAPQANITRAEFVAMIVRAMGETNSGKGTFKDVAAGEWYAGYLAKAADLGLIAADKDGNFRPMEKITRQDIAAITAKAHAIINNVDLADHSPSVTFTDAAKISSENLKYVGYVQKEGIIVGYNNAYRPLELATRAEAISIIRQMLYK